MKCQDEIKYDIKGSQTSRRLPHSWKRQGAEEPVSISPCYQTVFLVQPFFSITQRKWNSI